MATRTPRYPTAQQIRNLSNQELVDRKIISLAPASFGTEDVRPK